MTKVRIAQRMDIYKNAICHLEAANRIHDWNQQQLHVGYFDEGYDCSQLWKKNWELRRMDDVMRQLFEFRRSFEF